MSGTKWTEEESHLLRLLLPTNSLQEISEEFLRRQQKKISGFSTLRSADAIRKKCDRDSLTPESHEDYQDPFATRWEVLRSLTTKYREQHIDHTTGVMDSEQVTRKILCLSDLHIPFSRQEEIEQIVELHSDADICVLNGDIMDGYAFSTFPKSKKIPALAEYRGAFDLVDQLRQIFPSVVIVEGNHDIRAARALGRADFDADTSQVFRPNLLARIANGEHLDQFGELIEIKDFSNVTFQQSEPWYVQIGKTIFVHPHGWGGSAPGATVLKVDQQFRNRFGSDAYDSIVCGHTHRCYKGVWQNRLLIEQGSLSGRLGYEGKADLRMVHAMNGYSVIYQDKDGNTDFNNSGFIYLGSELPPKKPIL